MAGNISIIKHQIQRGEREAFLKQRVKVVWFTGLPCSGKTTLALELEKELISRKHLCYVLDGDNIRKGLNKDLGFSEVDRKENIRRVAEISKLFIDAGAITLSCFISPTTELREMAKSIIGQDDFIEVFVNCPLEICEQRDTKGMYRKARAGAIPDFTGVTSLYERPSKPAIELQTNIYSTEACTKKLIEHILPIIAL